MEQMPVNFQNCRKSLCATSYDSDEQEYMCGSTFPVFDFDGLKEWYVEKCALKLTKVPFSNDVLWLDDNHSVFIEFKNGKIGPTENNAIIFKIYDSLLVLLDDKFDLAWCCSDFRQNISYTREHMDYILVYNGEKYDEKNPTPQTRKGLERQDNRDVVTASARKLPQSSNHRTKINKIFRALGNRSLILFGLDRFKGYLFRQVYTLDQDEFQKYLAEQGVT